MSELRAPDPTLTALMELDWPYVYVIRAPDQLMPVAHREGGCTLAWHSTANASDARWYAVPCRECFPDAPELGHGRADVPDSGLSWQVAEAGHGQETTDG